MPICGCGVYHNRLSSTDIEEHCLKEWSEWFVHLIFLYNTELPAQV